MQYQPRSPRHPNGSSSPLARMLPVKNSGRLTLTLEAPDQATVTALEPAIPRITDQFNGFLRELRTDDLSGSAGAYRLRLELMRRVNLVIAPRRVNAVLIEEMLVQ